MIPAKIQFELKIRGITQKQIADELGIHPISVSREVNKIAGSERVRRAVARAIDRDPIEIFPEFYFRPKR